MPRWANENKWDHLITAAATKHAIPVWMIKAVIAKESGFDPQAYRPEPAIGDASRGLMQILYRTARGVGYTGPAGNDQTKLGGLFQPDNSIEYGSAYLAGRMRAYPRESPAAHYAAYNSGAVRRNDVGAFVNSKGATNVHKHVTQWVPMANYFRALEGLPPLPLPAPAVKPAR